MNGGIVAPRETQMSSVLCPFSSILSDFDGLQVVYRSESRTRASKGHEFNSRLFRFQATTLGKLFTRVCLFPNSATWYGSVSGDALYRWEDNRRSGVAVAMRQKLQWFIHLRAHSQGKGDEHLAYTPHGVWHIYLGGNSSPYAIEYECGWL